jgi:hypothetical protein
MKRIELRYLRAGLPIWFIREEERQFPLQKEELKTDVLGVIEKYYGPNFVDTLEEKLYPYLKIDFYLSSPIFHLRDLKDLLNTLGGDVIDEYFSSLLSNLNFSGIKRGLSDLIVKLNLLTSFYFLNQLNVQPAEVKKVVSLLNEIFPENLLAYNIAHYLRRNRPEEFASTLKMHKELIEEDKEVIKKFKQLLTELNIDIKPYLEGEKNFEKPVYFDKIAKILAYLSKKSLPDLKERIDKRSYEMKKIFGDEVIDSIKNIDPIYFMLYVLSDEGEKYDFNQISEDDSGPGHNLFIPLNPATKPPVTFMSHAGRCRFALWENALENAIHFSPVSYNLSDLPEEFIKDGEEGEKLLEDVRKKGLFLEGKEKPNVIGFNYARVVVLPLEILKEKLASHVYLEREIAFLLSRLNNSLEEFHPYEDSLNKLYWELYNNLVDSFKSSAWCLQLLKNGEKRLALARLKKVRSTEPALHKDNPFRRYKAFDSIAQSIPLENTNKNIKCRIMDFYVDFCGNINPTTLCEYSLLSKPYTFLKDKEKMRSVGLSYTLYELFNSESGKIEGIKVEEKIWRNFNVERLRSLSLYEILSLNEALKEYTMAALLAKKISSGEINV